MELPEDILMLILGRLPVKSIVRFCCISKRWRSLLSSSYFHDPHRLFVVGVMLGGGDLFLSAIAEEYINDRRRQTAEEADRIPNIAGPHDHVVDLLCPPCSGLVCLSVANSKQPYSAVIVCNPITREVVRIPAATPHDSWATLTDPRLCLGFDSVAKQHKLVRFFVRDSSDSFVRKRPDYRSREKPKHECEVHTLGSSAGWRLVGEIPYDFDGLGIHPAFVNGAQHWLTWTLNQARGQATIAIFAFDIHEERFRSISHPTWILSSLVTQLVEIGGRLCLSHLTRPRSCLDLWVLEDYDRGTWVKKYCINLEPLEGYRMPFGGHSVAPILITANGKIWLRLDYVSLHEYDPTSQVFRQILEYPPQFDTIFALPAASLAPVIST